MLSQKMVDSLNEQINKELYSAYLYQEFANYYGEVGLDGYQNWFAVQAKEELAHAMIFVDYLIANSKPVQFKAIDDPSTEIKSFRDPLVKALAHERVITASINELYGLAGEEKDYRTQQILDWFVKEQYEEEVNSDELITQYDLFGEDKRSLWEMNNELKSRQFTAPDLQL